MQISRILFLNKFKTLNESMWLFFQKAFLQLTGREVIGEGWELKVGTEGRN